MNCLNKNWLFKNVVFPIVICTKETFNWYLLAQTCHTGQGAVHKRGQQFRAGDGSKFPWNLTDRSEQFFSAIGSSIIDKYYKIVTKIVLKLPWKLSTKVSLKWFQKLSLKLSRGSQYHIIDKEMITFL